MLVCNQLIYQGILLKNAKQTLRTYRKKMFKKGRLGGDTYSPATGLRKTMHPPGIVQQPASLSSSLSLLLQQIKYIVHINL